MTEHLGHGHPEGMRHEEVGYERQDMRSKPVLIALAVLGIIVLLVHLFLTGVFHLAGWYYEKTLPPKNPMVTETNTDTRIVPSSEPMKFPEPRLEQNERLEMHDFRMAEEKTLNSYGWVDEQAGQAHMPIEKAMEMVAQRGLPTTPRAGVEPQSVVNTGKQAAGNSNTSKAAGKTARKKKE
ncbi:MAG: hypothetical protein M3O09_17575 [Acidobacteriota bacterium]|nr:hypothetical protein [Acidobacteriota bacterium]